MLTGKLAESIYKRSVYKTIHKAGYQGNDDTSGVGLGGDCAILTFASEDLVTAQSMANGKDAQVAVRAMQHAMNHIAVMGSKAMSMSLQVMVPQDYREAKLKKVLECAVELAEQAQLEIANTEVSCLPDLKRVIVTATGYGKKESDVVRPEALAKAGQELVMTKWIGMEGTVALVGERMGQLQERYPMHLLEAAAGFESYLSICEDVAVAKEYGAKAMHIVREGGIFGALWEFAQASGVGVCVDLKKIPVKQETIEVCEFFDLNPYELVSGGSLLLAVDRGMELVEHLQARGIAATVIGRCNDTNDRVIMNDEEKRFLESAKHEEFYRYCTME